MIRWGWTVQQPANMHSGSGGGGGKAAIDDLHFSHQFDKASTTLLQCCLSGKHIPEAVLTVRKAGGSPLEYLRIILQQVIVTRVEPFGYDNMATPLEKVRLSFAHIKMDYVLQNAQGKTAGTVGMGFDIKANAII